MTYKPYRGKRVCKRSLADILSDPYTAIQVLMAVIYIMAIALIIMAGDVIRLSKLPIQHVVTPAPESETAVEEPKQDADIHLISAIDLGPVRDAVEGIAAQLAVEEYVDPWTVDRDYILKVLTHEGGTDPVLCGCIAQALFNTCEKYNWEITPKEAMIKYRWTEPLYWYSEEAERAFDEVFYSGVTWDCVGNATMFYAPKYCDGTPVHESQIFVAEVNGVRFFEERG